MTAIHKSMKIGQLIMLTTAILLISGELYGQKRKSSRWRNRSSSARSSERSSTLQEQQTPLRYDPGNAFPKEQKPLTAAQKVQIDNCRKAVLQDNPKLLQTAMGKDFDINIQHTDGETLLKYAVKERKMKCLHYLLSLKPDINCTDIQGLTPLFHCSRDKDADIAEILIRAGARTSIQDIFEMIESEGPAIVKSRHPRAEDVCANVDLYSGFVYEMLGIPRDLYTPLFAIARCVSWCAHRMEELVNQGPIIRPAYKPLYRLRDYVPLKDRA